MNNSTVLVNLPESFKRKTFFTALGIVLFFIIYLGFIGAFLFLLSYTFTSTGALFLDAPHFITALVFIGANGFSAMILVLLLKTFIPSGNESEEKENRVEIKPADHPELFKLIYSVADEVKTYRPRKVYLIPDVNASVFHEQGIFSLFFPSHQNLNVGVGLMEVLTENELKAVLAHEFGHFSQNVTRFSGFIYRVNRMIVGVLYSDGGWENAINQASQLHIIVYLFAAMAVGTAKAIRWIFRKIYEMVNLSYLSLSRDLEFHADSVAVSVAGKQAMKNALRKLGYASGVLGTAGNYIDKFLKQDIQVKNMFVIYNHLVKYHAGRNELGLENGIPVITDNRMKEIVQARVNFKDQWASHPSTEERERNIDKCSNDSEFKSPPSIFLLADKDKVEEALTSAAYEQVKNERKNLVILDNEEVLAKVALEEKQVEINPLYNHFYFDRILDIDIDAAIKGYDKNVSSALRFDDVYSKENRTKIERFFQNDNDRQVLDAIKQKAVKTEFFEFDSVRYKRKQGADILLKIEEENKMLEEWIRETDLKSFWYNLYNAEQAGKREEYIAEFRDYYVSAKVAGLFSRFAGWLNIHFSNIHVLVTDESHIGGYLSEIRNSQRLLKVELKKLDTKTLVESVPDEQVKEKARLFIQEDGSYFMNLTTIKNDEVQRLVDFLDKMNEHCNLYYRKQLKKLTDMQLGWVNAVPSSLRA